MLTTVLLAIAVFGVLFFAMGIGAFFGRDTVKGSCGGVAGDGKCGVCGAESVDSCEMPSAKS